MKLLGCVFASAMGMNTIPSVFNVQVAKTCPADEPNAFQKMLAEFKSVTVSQVTISFDSNIQDVKSLMGTKAQIRQLNNRPKNCKPPINRKALKKAQAESTDGILSFTFNCPSVEASGVFVTARGKFCPIYEDARVLTKERLLMMSEWSEWSECDCDSETQTRTKTCEGPFCDAEIITESQSCSDQCLQCDDGFRAINNEFCMDIDECSENPYICAENASCINTEGSYECDCALYGDGKHLCVEPGPCLPGGSGVCDCFQPHFNFTMNTYWNNTADSCSFEYTIDPMQDAGVQVGDWNVQLDMPFAAAITGLWRANNPAGNLGYSHTFYPMFFNLNGLDTSLTFHAEAAGSCDSLIWAAEDIDFTYCTSEYVEPTTTMAPPAPTFKAETVPAWSAPPEPEIVLQDEECMEMDVQNQGGWVNEDGTNKRQMSINLDLDGDNAHNWRIDLNPSSPIEDIKTWNAEWDSGSVFTAKEYNSVISSSLSFNFILCSDDIDIEISPVACFNRESKP